MHQWSRQWGHFNLLKKNKIKILELLNDCFWSKNIPIEYIERFIIYSLCFGAYKKENDCLVGFGRVISDKTTYAYICDIVISSEYRGKKIGSQLLDEIMNHSDLKGLKTWSLRASEDSMRLYEKKGFKAINRPETYMEIDNLGIYSSQNFVNLHRHFN